MECNLKRVKFSVVVSLSPQIFHHWQSHLFVLKARDEMQYHELMVFEMANDNNLAPM